MPSIPPLRSPRNREWRVVFLDRVILRADYRFLDSLEEVSGVEATASHTPKTSNFVTPRDTLPTFTFISV